jgi:hypothetical protein
MASPLRLRKRLRLFFWPNLDDIQTMAKEDLRVMETEFQLIEIPQVEPPHPPIPEKLTSRQFRQKELVSGMEQLLPEILEESKISGDVVQIFLAITLLETVEETEAKFFFTEEFLKDATGIILDWTKAYQDKNYMLPPLMATVHWGFTPIVW